MDPLFKPLTQERKQELERKGYKEWEYMAMNKWNDPDSMTYHVCSATMLVISVAGRQFCRKNHQPCGLFTLNIILIPVFYFMAFKYKHVDQRFSNYRPRPTFNECLEFYPVTRRAWKKAMVIREQEMRDIRNKVSELNKPQTETQASI